LAQSGYIATPAIRFKVADSTTVLTPTGYDILYSFNNRLWYYDGSTWEQVQTGPESGGITNSAANTELPVTDSGGNLIGSGITTYINESEVTEYHFSFLAGADPLRFFYFPNTSFTDYVYMGAGYFDPNDNLFHDIGTTLNAPVAITLTDAAGSNTLPATVETSIEEHIQTLRNNVKQLQADVGGGAVDDVTITQPANGITVTNSGVAQTGNVAFTFALANDLGALEGLSGTGIAQRTGTDTWSLFSGSALTKTDDTNVTMTLSGSSSTALLSSVAMTLGWTGQLSLARGGSNANLTASNGGIVYSTASALAILSGTATAGQIIRSGSLAAPSWSTATYPATAGTSGNIMASDGTNFVSTTPPYYLLASGGTASAANTFTFNTANWHTISNTFTTTASGQWGNRFTGTQTLRATAADVFSQTLIDPTIVHAANTQVTAALTLSPTFTIGAFSNPVTSAIYIRNNGSTSNMNAPFLYEDTNTPQNKFQIRIDGSFRMGSSAGTNGIRPSGTNNGQLIITTDFANASSTAMVFLI